MMAQANETRSTSFYAAGVIDTDAWFRIAATDYEELIAGADFASALRPVRTLFDAGCGLGKFPALLAASLADTERAITIDYLDASPYCIKRFPESLAPPFRAGQGLATAIEDFEPRAGQVYDLVWAIQSVYAWDWRQLPRSLGLLRRLAGEAGDVLLYQAARDAFYHRFHDAYREAFAPAAPAFITAQEMWRDLERHGFVRRAFRFDHVVSADDAPLLEAYLRQLCFDSGRSLADFLQAPPTAALLAAHRTGQTYSFPQEVWLMGTRPIMDTLLHVR